MVQFVSRKSVINQVASWLRIHWLNTSLNSTSMGLFYLNFSVFVSVSLSVSLSLFFPDPKIFSPVFVEISFSYFEVENNSFSNSFLYACMLNMTAISLHFFSIFLSLQVSNASLSGLLVWEYLTTPSFGLWFIWRILGSPFEGWLRFRLSEDERSMRSLLRTWSSLEVESWRGTWMSNSLFELLSHHTFLFRPFVCLATLFFVLDFVYGISYCLHFFPEICLIFVDFYHQLPHHHHHLYFTYIYMYIDFIESLICEMTTGVFVETKISDVDLCWIVLEILVSWSGKRQVILRSLTWFDDALPPFSSYFQRTPSFWKNIPQSFSIFVLRNTCRFHSIQSLCTPLMI